MSQDLPKPATPRADVAPRLFVWPERLLFLGRLEQVASHRHAADVCLVALSGALRVQISPNEEWWQGRSAVIPAGCVHALDLRGSYVAVLYNDAHRPCYRLLSARDRREPVLGLPTEAALQKALQRFGRTFDEPGSTALIERSLGESLQVYSDAPQLDRRIKKIIERIQEDLEQSPSLETLAAIAGVSASRLQHLFITETGVPLRRFRTWVRFRSALLAIAQVHSFTDAALASGFANSAHFSHAFKAMFGVPARNVMTGAPAGSNIVFLPDSSPKNPSP